MVTAFRKPASDLGGVLVQSIRVIEEQVLACYNPPSVTPTLEKKSTIPEFEARLVEAVDMARTHLEKISHYVDMQKKSSSVKLSTKVLDSCACMIFLLQVRTLQDRSSHTVYLFALGFRWRKKFCLASMWSKRSKHPTASPGPVYGILDFLLLG